MNQNPNDFDNNQFLNSSSLQSNQIDNLSPAEREAVKKKAKRWFIILLIVGLTLGGIVAVGVVKILNELGLTNKPDQPVFQINK
ncbi:hypothetical protein PCC7424_3114 [Gloeothece citriformis PCC 7424]|uniref:Uncharacterized protein n=1 Tax=Gloeothece citriformis (strain PCC 7424) TaxID=65393 RepID=B7KBG0_GLOC7|nr:hypothetical protein [Gloeothece citriformis]ACK71516.1 hypothetical protein PCC7424_3114 [Gloeothece citriformis PCC 7424]